MRKTSPVVTTGHANPRSPTSGNTFDAFMTLAQNATTSTIGPLAPVGGILAANGTTIGLEQNTIVFSADTFAAGTSSGSSSSYSANPINMTFAPPPDMAWNPDVQPLAGGTPPASYNWTTSVSDNAVSQLQFLLFLDSLFLDFLVKGTINMTTGSWKNLYPPTIVESMQIMTAQTYVHRYASSDSLKHYGKPYPAQCHYSYPVEGIKDWSATALIILGIETASIIDIITRAAVTDPWMIPVLSSALGSKARMSGLINMIEGNSAAPAARESTMPPELAYSYLMHNYVVPNSCTNALPYNILPALRIEAANSDSTGRVTKVNVNDVHSNQLYMAWWGAWGTLTYTPLVNGVASVPDNLYGYVWGCVTQYNTATSVDGLVLAAMTSPDMIWVGGPQNSPDSTI